MKKQEGTALIEFALILPLLIILVFLTTEFGRAYYQYNTIAKSVRQAARYLSMRSPNVDVDKARNIVVYGNTAGTGTPLVPGLSLSNVPTPTWSTTGSYPTLNTVTVTVTGYTFVPIVKGVSWIAFDDIAFGSIQATLRSPT